MSYVEAGYSIGLGVLFLYAVALVLRRRRWERALQVIERAEPADRIGPPPRPEHAEPSRTPNGLSRCIVEVAKIVEVAEHAQRVEAVDVAEEQTAPGARS